MTTVGDAIRNSWLHVFSFDNSIPRGYQKETIKEVLKEINRIKDEMNTIHVRFSDVEQGKLDISVAHQLESQFEKLKQQLQLHTLLIGELKKHHSIINELLIKSEEKNKEDEIIKREIRDLKSEIKKLSDRDNNKLLLERVISLENDYKELIIKSSESNELRDKLDTITSQVKILQEQKISCKDNIRTVNELKEDFTELITCEIPELKAEVQRKMNKTIAVTNELKSNYNDVIKNLNLINEEKIQEKSMMNELLNEVEKLRIQIENIKKTQTDDADNILRQDGLINQCVTSISKLANSISNLQDKISQHLITLKGKTSIPSSPFNKYSEFTEVKQFGKSKFSLPETPSTQAPPLINNKIGTFFNMNGSIQSISSSSTTRSIGIDEITNISSITSSSSNEQQNFLSVNEDRNIISSHPEDFSDNLSENSKINSKSNPRTPLPRAHFKNFLKAY